MSLQISEFRITPEYYNKSSESSDRIVIELESEINDLIININNIQSERFSNHSSQLLHCKSVENQLNANIFLLKHKSEELAPILESILKKIGEIESQLLKMSESADLLSEKGQIIDIASELHAININCKKEKLNTLDPFKSLEGLGILSPNVRQIPVSLQHSDESDSGLENCAYHSLKNALISLYASQNSDPEVSKLFKNKDLFTLFYNKYCLPFVEDKPLGRRDGSPSLVREIIQKFKNDKTPPAELEKIQESFKTIKESSLATFNLSYASVKGFNLGLIDEGGFADGEKLYHFAKNPGPSVLSTMIGIEASGHWFTLTLHKDIEGNVEFYCCDSMNNHHDISGESSPLLKVSQGIKAVLSNPDKFLKDLLKKSDIVDVLSRSAGWIAENRNETIMLNDKPNPLIAKLGVTDGSEKQERIHQLINTFELIQRYNLLNSHDFEIQMLIGDLKEVIAFYVAKLDSRDPNLSKLENYLKIIKEKHSEDLIESMYKEAIDDLNERRDKLKLEGLSETLLDRTITAFEHFSTIYQNLKLIAAKTTESERNVFIDSLLPSGEKMGAEAGFSAGSSNKSIERGMQEKVGLLVKCYQQAKDQELIGDFCKAVGGGDPCITSRVARLYLFAAKLQGIRVEEEVRKTLSDFPNVVISIKEAVMTLNAEAFGSIDPEVEQASRKMVAEINSDYFKSPENLSLLSEQLSSKLSSKEERQSLLETLYSPNELANQDSITWDQITLKLLDHPLFKDVLLKSAKEFILMSF